MKWLIGFLWLLMVAPLEAEQVNVAAASDLNFAIKEIIQANSDFQLKLRTLKETSKDSAYTAEAKEYEFALLDATDAVDGDLDNARELLQEQEKAAAEAKAAKKAKGK